MMRTLSRIFIAAALALVAGTALAQTADVQINASVLKTCTVVNNNPIVNIVNYDPNAGAATTANGSLTLNCSKGTRYNFTVNDGQWLSGTRRLRAPLPAAYLPATEDFMTYDFLVMTMAGGGGFSPGVYTSAGTGSVLRTGDRSTGNATSLTLGFQASIAAGQDAASDATTDYTDTVRITISY